MTSMPRPLPLLFFLYAIRSDCFYATTTSGAIIVFFFNSFRMPTASRASFLIDCGCPPHPERHHRIWSDTTFQFFIGSWLIVFFFLFLTTSDATFHCAGCIVFFFCFLPHRMPPFIAPDATLLRLIVIFL